jgi:hypothetical protein
VPVGANDLARGVAACHAASRYALKVCVMIRRTFANVLRLC